MLKSYLAAKRVIQSWKDENGQDLIEYALLGALLSVASVTAIGGVATKLITVFGNIVTAMG